MHRLQSRVAAFAAFFLLSACGGGGGGAVSSTPPPPPPPSELTYDSFPLTESATFQTIAGVRSYVVAGNRRVDTFEVIGRNSGITFKYDAASGSYAVTDAVTSATFDATHPSTSGNFDSYASASGTNSDELRVYSNIRSGASQVNAPVKLTYLSFGSWSRDDSASGEHRDSYFLSGYPTEASDMPKTGSASYSTAVTANGVTILAAQDEAQIDGSATFTANFADASVSTALTLSLPGFGSPTYNGTGTISDNQFSGDFTTSSDPEFNSGSFAGGFFGPSAKEMGYTFTLSRGADDPYAGATPRPPLAWIVGGVAGTKKSN